VPTIGGSVSYISLSQTWFHAGHRKYNVGHFVVRSILNTH
jgi:hypothetical protein